MRDVIMLSESLIFEPSHKKGTLASAVRFVCVNSKSSCNTTQMGISKQHFHGYSWVQKLKWETLPNVLRNWGTKDIYQPCHEKTCLRGLRPGKTQTGLLSYRDKLESWNFRFSKYSYYTNNKDADQTVRMRRLICVFVVRIWYKQVLSWHGSSKQDNKTLLISRQGNKVKRYAMIRNWYNQIPYPTLKTKREITKYINWQQFKKGTRGKPSAFFRLFFRRILGQVTLHMTLRGSQQGVALFFFCIKSWHPVGTF